VSQPAGDFQAALDKANELYRRYHAENDPRRLDEAIEGGEDALALASTWDQRSQALAIKAAALQDRYWRTTSLADLDESIRVFEVSASLAPADKSHSLTVYGLGLSLLERAKLAIRSGDSQAARQDLTRAIERLEFLVRLVSFNRLDRMKMAQALDDLGAAYKEQYVLGGRRRDYRKAVECQQRALKLLPPLRVQVFASVPGLEVTTALCARHLGETFLAHFSRTGSMGALGKAISNFGFSLRLVADPLTFEAAATAWTESFKRSRDPRRLDNAKQCLRDAVGRGLEVAPLVALRASRAWMAGLLDGTFGDPQAPEALAEALEAARLGLRAMRLIVSTQAGLRFEAEARRQIVGFGAEAAFVLARHGRVPDALSVAESTGASIAGEALRGVSDELDQLAREGHGELARSYRELASGPPPGRAPGQ
jgi:tetratricopeptide (TPR) repeat protein